MAKPGRTGAYANQASAEVGDAIAFVLDDGNWTESPTFFEVNIAPPGFTRVAPTPGFPLSAASLGGIAGCKMLYIIFVRGVNAEGAGDWFPLQWTVSTVATTARTLYGLPVDWPATPQHVMGGGAMVLYVKRPGSSPVGPIGVFYVNDIALDGSATLYGAAFKGFQILANGVGATFLRASDPGWEVIIDTNG